MTVPGPNETINMASVAGVRQADESMVRRRIWTIQTGGREHAVMVQYTILSGFMSIEIDGQRVARAWREWQTVVGGANLETTLDGHALVARITQRYGTQTYLISLRLDGDLLAGSDDQPTPRQVTRQTWAGIVSLAMVVAVVTMAWQSPVFAAWSVLIGVASVTAIRTKRLPGRWVALAILALIVAWAVGLGVLSAAHPI